MVDIKKGSPWESVVLTTLSRDRHVFNELLSEARQLAVNLQEGKTVVYTCWGLEWKPFGQPRRKRPLNSVVLDEGVKERIVGDVKDFLSASRYYYDRGSLLLKVRVVDLTLRNTVSTRIFVAWSSWKWEDEFHSGTGWGTGLQSLHTQSVRTGPNGRPSTSCSEYCS